MKTSDQADNPQTAGEENSEERGRGGDELWGSTGQKKVHADGALLVLTACQGQLLGRIWLRHSSACQACQNEPVRCGEMQLLDATHAPAHHGICSPNWQDGGKFMTGTSSGIT